MNAEIDLKKCSENNSEVGSEICSEVGSKIGALKRYVHWTLFLGDQNMCDKVMHDWTFFRARFRARFDPWKKWETDWCTEEVHWTLFSGDQNMC